jgi:aspartate racemase
MSWESTAEYYRIINESVRDRLGGTHSARLVLHSVDFHEIERFQHNHQWGHATAAMIAAARSVELGGAECLVICTNTMHRMADEIQAAVDIPLVHIADGTAAAIQAAGANRPGLLGTRFTMEHNFYRGRLKAQHGIDVIIPDDDDRTVIHDIIYEELILGLITPESKAAYLGVIDRLIGAGADSVIAGCTEIEQLVTADNVAVPYFPTTRLHAEAAVEWAFS